MAIASSLPTNQVSNRMTTDVHASARTYVLAHLPYLNCEPFFHGLALGARWRAGAMSPRQLGQEAEAGRVAAGPMSLVDFLRLQDRFERMGHLGIAARGRSGSTFLFSRVPMRQLGGAAIAVTEDTSTTAMLLRLILEQREHLPGIQYRRVEQGWSASPARLSEDVPAMLLIGDEAMQFRAANRTHPFEVDLSFEWWLWQHLPCVFAVWAVRRECDAEAKDQLNRAVFKALSANHGRLPEIGRDRAAALGLPPEAVTAYLEQFVYRLGELEEQGISRFTELAHEHHLL